MTTPQHSKSVQARGAVPVSYLRRPQDAEWTLRPFQRDDCWAMLPNIRQADRTEWHRATPMGVHALELSCQAAAELWTVCNPCGEPSIILGVSCFPGMEPMVWLIGTPDAENKGLYLMYLLKDFQREFFKRWPVTHCYSDQENVVHHRWLSWLGYRSKGVVPYGPNGFPFVYFRRA